MMSDDVDLQNDFSRQEKARSSSPTKLRSKQRRSRKRSFWQSDGEGGADGSKQVEGAKRKKRKLSKRKSEQVEHKFLIGGDISDPLNLKTDDLPGVDDVKVTDNSQCEYKHSIHLVPHPQTDPLQLEHLEGDQDATKDQAAKKRRKRKRQNSESQREETKPKPTGNIDDETSDRMETVKTDTKSSNPVAVPPSSKSSARSTKPAHSGRIQSPKEQDSPRFRFGNYYRYYGYRNPGGVQDERLNCLKLEWFEGKACLDIGCNVGHFTLSVARDFKPKLIVGLDIDSRLISIAKKNIRHYISPLTCEVEGKQVEFPLSLLKSFGPIAGVPLPGKESDGSFPNNVEFKAGNWVFKTDAQLEEQKPEYDVVFLLSTTKWIHLNWGDEGLKRAFKRIYRSLKPGGLFIMEPQEFKSYYRKKKITPEIFSNYQAIQLCPEKFTGYLLSEVGFSSCQELRAAESQAQGFKRPILLYTKPEEQCS